MLPKGKKGSFVYALFLSAIMGFGILFVIETRSDRVNLEKNGYSYKGTANVSVDQFASYISTYGRGNEHKRGVYAVSAISEPVEMVYSFDSLISYPELEATKISNLTWSFDFVMIVFVGFVVIGWVNFFKAMTGYPKGVEEEPNEQED